MVDIVVDVDSYVQIPHPQDREGKSPSRNGDYQGERQKPFEGEQYHDDASSKVRTCTIEGFRKTIDQLTVLFTL